MLILDLHGTSAVTDQRNMALELETVHWDNRVDSVFEDETSVPHYNYRIQPREALGSSNLEVFVEEETITDLGEDVRRTSRSSGVSSPPAVGEDAPDCRGGSTGSTSSLGLKYNSVHSK